MKGKQRNETQHKSLNYKPTKDAVGPNAVSVLLASKHCEDIKSEGM